MALTLQLQSLQCNVPDSIGMRDKSKKANFPVIPLVAVVIFYLGIAPLSLLCWPMSLSCVHATPSYLPWLWILWRQKSLLWLRYPSLSWQLFQSSSSSGFLCFLCWQPVADLFLSPGRGAAGDPCRARSPPALCWRWDILFLPSLPCPVSLSISFFVSMCVCFPCCLSLARIWFVIIAV